MNSDVPMLIVVRRPRTPKEWTVAITSVTIVVGTLYAAWHAHGSTLADLVTGQKVMESQIHSIDKRTSRIEDALIGRASLTAMETPP